MTWAELQVEAANFAHVPVTSAARRHAIGSAPPLKVTLKSLSARTEI